MAARTPRRFPIPQRKRVFLGCEGDSERSYGRWLQSLADELGLNLHIDSQKSRGGDPCAVIGRCITGMKHKERQREPYSHRAILLDSDRLNEDQDRDQRGFVEAERNDVSLVFQVFDHEAFLLRHFPGCETRRPPKNLGMVQLKAVWPEYEKPMTGQELSQKLDLTNLQRACSVEAELKAFLNDLGFPV